MFSFVFGKFVTVCTVISYGSLSTASDDCKSVKYERSRRHYYLLLDKCRLMSVVFLRRILYLFGDAFPWNVLSCCQLRFVFSKVNFSNLWFNLFVRTEYKFGKWKVWSFHLKIFVQIPLSSAHSEVVLLRVVRGKNLWNRNYLFMAGFRGWLKPSMA